MSEKVLITLIWAGAAIIVSIVLGLVGIALTHDGTNEATIVIALIGFAGPIITGASTLAGHWLGGRSANGGQQP